MIITPKIRGFICTTAHPTGCSQHVQEQIDYVKQHAPISGKKKVLVIGASTGYGLASRIVASFGCGADTLGIIFEKAAEGKRTASAGWYNSAAFEHAAKNAGVYAKTINGDAFSDDIKQQTIEAIKNDMGKVDCIIYSLASPRRTNPRTGVTHHSVLKTIGEPFTDKTVNTMTGEISNIEITPANEQEISDTVTVMGGEDWQWWIEALIEADVIAENALTVAYSYIGPKITYPIYRNGTIGKAKEHLESTAKQLTKQLASLGGQAYVSVNKALVTQSSAAIPVVPLYISLLYKIMKSKNIHEGCIEQMVRLFRDHLFTGDTIATDEKGLIRVDDWEMREDVQTDIEVLWSQVTTENIEEITDIQGYRNEFYKLFGFGLSGVDYEAEVNPDVNILSVND